jgi:hypothetical protein
MGCGLSKSVTRAGCTNSAPDIKVQPAEQLYAEDIAAQCKTIGTNVCRRKMSRQDLPERKPRAARRQAPCLAPCLASEALTCLKPDHRLTQGYHIQSTGRSDRCYVFGCVFPKFHTTFQSNFPATLSMQICI